MCVSCVHHVFFMCLSCVHHMATFLLVQELTSLLILNVSHNKLVQFPLAIFSCTLLTQLDLTHNSISTFLPPPVSLPHLEVLRLSHNRLLEYPEGLDNTNFPSLSKVFLDSNQIAGLPPKHLKLDELTTLSMSRNALEHVPKEFLCSLTSVKVFNLSKNALGTLSSYMCMCVCNTHMHTHTHSRTHTHMCTHARTQACTHTQAHHTTYTHTHAHVHTHKHTTPHTHTHMHMHTHTLTYTHTHHTTRTHIQINCSTNTYMYPFTESLPSETAGYLGELEDFKVGWNKLGRNEGEFYCFVTQLPK